MNCLFIWKKITTDELWLFRLGYLIDIVLKMSKIDIPLLGKQQIVFVANHKI